MDVKERYVPIILGVNATATSSSENVGGFLAATSGTITITKNNSTGTVILNAFPVTAGIWTPIPFYVGTHGVIITLAGGASGVLGV